MPHSDDNNFSHSEDIQAGQNLAVFAELFFLLNLVFLPVIGFVVLAVLYFRYRDNAPALARCHLRQTFNASIWAGILLVVVNVLIILFGGYDSPYIWIIVILYLTCFHTVFIMYGTFGLTRAMNGQHYHYPLIGRECKG